MTLQWPASTSTPLGSRGHETFAALRSEVERGLDEGHLVSLVVEAPVVTPELLTSPELELSSDLAPCAFWHSAELAAELDHVAETWVGLGVAKELTAPWGDTEALRRFAAEALRGVRLVGPGAKAVAPRVLAAVGFAPPVDRVGSAPGNGETWADFPGAWAVLPRLTYVLQRGRENARDAKSAWFCLVLTPSERSALDVSLAHLTTLAKKLRNVSMQPGVPAEAAASSVQTSETTWAGWVGDALRAINDGRVEKVVAARVKELSFAANVSPSHTLLSLAERHGDSTRFAFFRGRSAFLGATPERLIVKRGSHVETEALAGTVRRREATAGDESTGDFGPKEHKEHSPVLAQILATLTPFCASLTHDPVPRLRAQRQVLHLRTTVRGVLSSPCHALSLVRALHPTPAVGGRPTAQALDWIREHEDFDRGLYAGPVGWVDASGDGQFNVALRCGVLRDDRATLFAGAGLVMGSDPRREFEETALKLQVLQGSLCHAPSTPTRRSDV